MAELYIACYPRSWLDTIGSTDYVRQRLTRTVENQQVTSVEYENLADTTKSEELILDHLRFSEDK